MSHIPSSVMPHAFAQHSSEDDDSARPSLLGRLVRMAAVPALFGLGLSVMTLSVMMALLARGKDDDGADDSEAAGDGTATSTLSVPV
jgi:hypothetical protein